MKSGELLLQLLEVMSGVASGKKTKDTKLRIQQIQNVNDAIDFAKKVGVDFTKIRISAEDFVDGKEQSVLAAVFQIIIRFLKFDDEEESKTGGGGIDVREALMLWLKNKTAGYAGITIKDFTKSFHDGLPFLALIHKLRPRLVDYDTCVSRGAKINVQEALSLGEKYLSIPQYIGPDDLKSLNEISMLVYLTDWYAGVVLLQKQDIAAARIGKLEDITELHDKLRANYLERATALKAWVTSTIAAQADRTIDDTMAGIRARVEEFHIYKKVAKTEQIGLKLDALALYDNLAARLVNNNRPTFTPAGLLPADLETLFTELEKSEVARSQYLNAELTRQIQLATLYKRFQGNGSKLSVYATDKDAQIKALPTGNSQDALDSLDSLDVIQVEVTQTVNGPLVELNRVGDNLVAERFEFKADVIAIQTSINANLKAVQDLIVSLRHELYEKLYGWYTGIASGLVSFATSTIAAQADRTIDDTMAGAKQRLEEFETYKKDTKPHQVVLLEEAKSLYENITSRLAIHQREPFAPVGLVPSDLINHFQQLDQSETARSAYLNTELTRQLQLAKLYRRFQSNAPKLLQFTIDKDAQIKALPSSNTQEALDSLDSLDVIEIEVKQTVSGPLVELNRVGDNLVAERFEFKADVTAAQTQINANSKSVQELIVALRNELYEKLFAWYTATANFLVSFVTSTIAAQADRTIDDTMAGILARLAEFEAYKKDTKPPQVDTLETAKNLHKNISIRLANHQREPFTPAGLVPADLTNHFHQLDQSEAARAAYLGAELTRQLKLAELYRRFQSNAPKLLQFTIDKDAQIKALPYSNFQEALSSLDSLDVIETEVKQTVSGPLVELNRVGDFLVAERFEFKADVTASQTQINANFKAVQELIVALRNEWYTKLFAWYTDIATGLVSFVTSTIAAQADRTIDDTMSGIRARLEEFDSYKKNTKPPQLDSLETAKNLHKNISIRLVNHQREPFTPAGLVPDNLTHHFQQLDHSETARAAYLSAELTRQLQLAELYRQFQSNAPKLLQFTNDKDAQTKALPSSNTEEALDSLDSLDVIEIEVKQSVSGPLVELNRVGDFLVAERFEFKADVTAQQTQINANFKSIQELIVALRNEWYEKLFAWYTGIATGLVSFVTSTIAAQADRTIDDTMSGIRARLAEFEAYKKNIKPPQVDLLDTAKQLHKNISIRLANHQREPFTPAGLVPADLTNHFQQLDQSETARAAYLSAELTRQIQLAELYRQFQGNAPKLLQFAADKDAQIKALPSANSEDALDSLDSLDVIEIEVKQSVSGPLVELNRVGDNLVAERFEFKADVTATQTQTNANYKAVQELIVALRNELYEKLFAWYSGIATGLVSFVTSTIAVQADRTIDNTMSGVKGRLEQFETYKKTDKREQVNIFADAKSLYENISSRLVNHQRDAYTPAGLVPSDLAHHFHQLDQSEVARAAYLHAELARQIQLAKAYRQFQGNTAKLNQWLKEKEPTLKAPLAINSVDDAVSEIDTIDILTSELNNVVSGALTDFQKLSQRLVSESFEESKSVSETEVELTTTFTNVQNELKAKNVDAQAQLRAQRDTNERLYQAFASAVTTLQTFVQAKRDALHSEEKADADKQLTVVEGLVADSEAATAGLVGAVESADKDVQARELVNNPHTNVSASDAVSTLTFFTVLIQKKVALLKEHVEEKKRGGLSPEQIAEIHANFAYFDKDSNGFLNKKELRTCLQSLGEESTPQSINVILDKYDSGKKGTLTKAEFEVFIRESLGDTGTAEEIIKSFRYLTYDAPFFTEQNLLNVVNNRTFTEHHVDYLKQEVKQTESGHYDYATWTAEAFAR